MIEATHRLDEFATAEVIRIHGHEFIAVDKLAEVRKAVKIVVDNHRRRQMGSQMKNTAADDIHRYLRPLCQS